jgi:uncharacterized protein involved in exopolysaccharide biosynthesis
MDLFVDEKASSLKFLKLLLKNFWLILIFSTIGLGVGITVTFFIPKKYLSYSVIFPPNSNLGLNVLEDPRFGNSLDADQLMQLLDSRQLKDTIIQLYDLETYYGVNKSNPSWKRELEKDFDEDISFSKTRYYSVVITAKTKKPELSAQIVNSIVEIIDEFRLNIVRQNQMAAFKYAEEQYLSQKLLVDELRKNIYNKKSTQNPHHILYNHLLEATKINHYETQPFVDSEEMEDLVQSYSFELGKLNDLKIDYHKAQRLMKKPLSKVFVVSRAQPSYKKISPSLRVNALIGFFSSLLFIILFVVIRDRIGEVAKMLRN